MLLDYIIVFIVGGSICMVGQILLIRTQMTTARILVLFLLIGVVLEAFGLYEPFAEFGKSGAMIPICGFGSTLAKGAIEGASSGTLLGVIKGGLSATAAGVAASVFFSYIFAMIFKSKTKKSGK